MYGLSRRVGNGGHEQTPYKHVSKYTCQLDARASQKFDFPRMCNFRHPDSADVLHVLRYFSWRRGDRCAFF